MRSRLGSATGKPLTTRWLILAALLFAGCSTAGRESNEVLATIDGESIKMSDIDSETLDRLALMDYEFQRERHDVLAAAVDIAVRDKLLEGEAARRGISLDELVEIETGDKIEVTYEEVVNLYRRNIQAFGGRSVEEMQPQIEEYLVNYKRDQLLSGLAQRLAGDRDLAILLEPVRVELDNGDSPAFGPANAPVTLVEFSDFECPYCGRFFETINQLKENYGDRLRVVYRQYPLDIHANAYAAAVASLCANDQGRFWEMHDLMFSEQSQLDREALKEKAGRIGLDQGAFDACLASPRHTPQIESDMREANRIGLSGTPFVLVNGVQVPGGAAPYPVIAELIDEELERKGYE